MRNSTNFDAHAHLNPRAKRVDLSIVQSHATGRPVNAGGVDGRIAVSHPVNADLPT
jgi:hypothetical protein